MPTKTYNTAHNTELLLDELLSAFPPWRGVWDATLDGWLGPLVELSGDGTVATITWADATPESAVDTVVAAHNPNGENESQRRQRESREARVATAAANPNQAAKLEDVQRLAKALGVDWIW